MNTDYLIGGVLLFLCLCVVYKFCRIAAADFKNLECAKRQKILIVIAVVAAAVFSYNLFFRYEYKVQKGTGYTQVIKIDRLTGQSSFTVPEYAEQKKK